MEIDKVVLAIAGSFALILVVIVVGGISKNIADEKNFTTITSNQGCNYIGTPKYTDTPLMECDCIVKVVRGK